MPSRKNRNQYRNAGSGKPNGIVAWGVLFFSLSLILLAYTPLVGIWSWKLNPIYHVPVTNMPIADTRVMGILTGVFALFLLISAFWEVWANKVEEFILKRLHFLTFIIIWLAYIMIYLRGVSFLVLGTQPKWLVESVFYAGLILFLLIPVHYFLWIARRSKEGNK